MDQNGPEGREKSAIIGGRAWWSHDPRVGVAGAGVPRRGLLQQALAASGRQDHADEAVLVTFEVHAEHLEGAHARPSVAPLEGGCVVLEREQVEEGLVDVFLDGLEGSQDAVDGLGEGRGPLEV